MRNQDTVGHVFRPNMPYDTATSHGTMRVGFTAEEPRLTGRLESLASPPSAA